MPYIEPGTNRPKMIVRHLQIRNFMSFLGNHGGDIAPGLTYIMGQNMDDPATADSNAAGKTTLINAISWALNGVTASGIKGPSVVNHNAAECRVILTMSDGLVVDRFQGKKNSLKVTYKGEVWAGDMPVIQDRLWGLMGIGAKLYGSTVYMGKNAESSQFLHTRPANRAEIMSDLVDDGLFQTAADLIKQELRRREQEQQGLANQISQAQEWVRKLTQDATTLAAQVKSAEAQESLRKAELKDRLANCNAHLTAAQLVILRAPARSMKELEDQRRVFHLRLQDVEGQLRETGYTAMPALALGEACPTCLSPFTAAAHTRCQDIVQEVKATRAGLKKEIDGLQKSIELIQTKQREVRDLEMDKAKAKRDFEFYQIEIGHIEEELNVPTLSTQALLDNLQSCKEKLSAKQRELNKLTADSTKSIADIAKLNILRTGFSVEIRNYMFDQVRSQLDYYTKVYAYELAGTKLSIEYPSTSKSLKEKFDIILRMDGQEQDIACYSGGEGWRASFAVLLALRDTMLQISKSKLNFLLIDDPVGMLCKTGTLQWGKMLRKLADSGRIGQILVTIPRDDLLDSHGNILNVMKTSGCSSVTEWG